MKRFTRIILLAVTAAAFLGLGGCAATSVALQHKDLVVQSDMSKTIFLPMTSDKTFAIEVRNSSATSLDTQRLQNEIANGLISKGYQMVSPEQAHYQVQLNIVRMTTTAQAAGANGGGFAAGALAGGNNGNMQGALIGGLIGGIADTVVGSLVKNVTATMVAELQIAAKQSGAVATTTRVADSQGTSGSESQSVSGISHRIDYRTRIDLWANQVNLKVQDAVPQLQYHLVRNVVGLF